MKDYTIYDDEKKFFILGYKIENDKIIVKYANGNKTEHFISKQTIDLLNTIMEHQVSKGNKYCVLFEQDLKEEKNFVLLYSLLMLLILPTVIFPINLPIFHIFSQILFLLITYLDGESIFNAKKIKDKLNDIEKSNLFLENKKIILEDKQNHLNEIKKKNNHPYSNLINDNYFTINDIDSISLNTLKEDLKVKVKKR